LRETGRAQNTKVSDRNGLGDAGERPDVIRQRQSVFTTAARDGNPSIASPSRRKTSKAYQQSFQRVVQSIRLSD
jgi:hypothetical protein